MIDKWLNAGVLEDGLLRHATEGSPQGGGDYSPYAKGNFTFDRVICGWRTGLSVVNLRLKK